MTQPLKGEWIKGVAHWREPAIRHDWTAIRLRQVQRWVNRRIWRTHPFSDYDASVKTNPHGPVRPSPLFEMETV